MPVINDPTLIGWITLVMYIIAAGLCAAAWLRARDRRHWPRRVGSTLDIARPAAESRFWAALTMLLILLGINKQLDVQTLLTEGAKRLAQAQGWYDRRAAVQVVFTVLACAGLAGLLFMFARLTWGAWGRHLLSLLGVSLILAYVVVRLMNIEGMDERVGVDFSLVEDLWAVEWAGLACIGISAVQRRN